jgi:hypothetical protein
MMWDRLLDTAGGGATFRLQFALDRLTQAAPVSVGQ